MLLEAKEIRKTFYHPKKVQLIKGVNLAVSEGETVAIIGRSGQGKSTLLQILGTLEKPCAGQLTICNQKVSLFNKNLLRSKFIGFVFQSFHLLEDHTALENILMPARIARKNTHRGSPAYLYGYELLEKVGMGERAHFHTNLLSGGEKQRIAIARAMCNNPEIIFADEPSGNLDEQTSEGIHQILLKFAKSSNKALIVVTHDPRLAALCDTRYHLQDGLLFPA
jgi:lipoprotein-releasing system ATP-binding protein